MVREWWFLQGGAIFSRLSDEVKPADGFRQALEDRLAIGANDNVAAILAQVRVGWSDARDRGARRTAHFSCNTQAPPALGTNRSEFEIASRFPPNVGATRSAPKRSYSGTMASMTL